MNVFVFAVKNPAGGPRTFFKNNFYKSVIMSHQLRNRDTHRESVLIQHLFDNSGFLQSVFDAVPSFLFIVDPEARIQHLNAAALSLLETDKKHVLYNRWGEALHCVHATEAPGGCGHAAACRNCVIRNSVNKVFNGQNVRRETVKLGMFAGSRIEEKYFALTTAPFSHMEGKFALIVLEDVTREKMFEESLERRVAERTAELAESEERYRKVLETAQEGIWFLDPEAKIIFANRGMALMLGASKEELLGRSAYDFIEESCLPEFRARFFFERQTGLAEQSDLRLKGRDGSIIFAIMSVNPRLDGDGRFMGYVIMVLDITERRRLESIAQAASLMDNLGYVFSGVRHELGNPINTLKITLAVLGKNFENFSAEKTKNFLDQASAEIGKMEFLLKSLKNFNMYEHLEPENTGLSAFFEKFLALVKEDFRRKGIEIETLLPGDDVSAHADPRALQQVLLNLMTNAADALEGMPQPAIKISVRKTKGAVLIEVEDNGRGISEKEFKNLFKPFCTTKPKGTGLGLAIVKKMMVKMHGDVEIKSREGKGTTVRLHLPPGL